MVAVPHVDSSDKTALSSRAYHYYERNVFPKVSDFRGTDFVRRNLREMALSNTEQVSDKTTGVNELKWDNLIILDACRHDIYQEIRGCQVDYRISCGSHSQEFIQSNFSKQSFKDTVVATGNPFYNDNLPELDGFKDLTGREIRDTFKSVSSLFPEDVNSKNGVVLPHKVSQAALSLNRKHPDSRMIVHLMQPHTPHVAASYSFDDTKEIWQQCRNGNISEQVLREGYKSNLKYVLNLVEKLAQELDGRTVVTGDHGEFLGEQGFYGHPTRSSSKVVRKVPVEVIS